MNGTLRISLVQYDIAWEDIDVNLAHVNNVAHSLLDETDILVLPEMFSTGFSMNSQLLAEPITGKTISTIKRIAKECDMAICGSYIAVENQSYYNRGFFITPDQEYYYDKKHLFRMGEEPKNFTPGSERLIVQYKDFNICLLICYDLRFPVWARNVNNEYDLLLYTANWPASRALVWNTLLQARALENQCYVCGVNRIGVDGYGLTYQGESQLIDAKGHKLLTVEQNRTSTVYISKEELQNFRTKFPVWLDADKFELI